MQIIIKFVEICYQLELLFTLNLKIMVVFRVFRKFVLTFVFSGWHLVSRCDILVAIERAISILSSQRWSYSTGTDNKYIWKWGCEGRSSSLWYACLTFSLLNFLKLLHSRLKLRIFLLGIEDCSSFNCNETINVSMRLKKKNKMLLQGPTLEWNNSQRSTLMHFGGC